MRKLLFIFLFFTSFNAFALQEVYYTSSMSSFASFDVVEVCKKNLDGVEGFTYTGCTPSGSKGDYETQVTRDSDGGKYGYGFAYYNKSTCAEGYRINLTNRVCEPYIEPPVISCSSGVQNWYDTGSSRNLTSVCSSGCTAVATGMQITIDGFSSGQFTTNGKSCTGSDTGTPDPGTCPKGTTNISSSGPVNCTADKPPAPKCWVGSTNVSTDPLIAVCVADGGPPKTGPDDPNSHVSDTSKTPTTKSTTVTEPTSDGGVKSTTTTTTTTINTDGSTSVSSNTSTTVTSPTGESKTTVDGNKAEDPSKDFCKQNPTLTICKNSSVSGDCESLTIDGDAIQGAILRQQKKEYCDNLAQSAIKDLGLALIANADPMQTQFPTIDNATIVDLSNIGNLDSSGFLSGGSCFSDKSFAVAGITVKLPISILCDYLIPLRLAVMLLALMASYKMISGTVLRDL